MKGMRQIMLTLATASLAAACGAPTKSAGDVAYLFSGAGVTLQDKLSGLCRTLQGRTQAPTLSGLDLNVDGCPDAGLAALNYRDLTAFQFLGIEGDIPPAEKKKIVRKTVRAQVWLNKTLLGFASALGGKFKDAKNQAGALEAPDSGKAVQNIIKIDVSQPEPFKFDAEKFELGALLSLKASGIVSLDNDIRISGKLIDGAFAVTIATTEDRPYERSILKSVSGLVLIVPHASDIYMDMFVDVQAHNAGFADLFKTQISGLLSDGLKKMADSVLTL